jgi:hypothetical protein
LSPDDHARFVGPFERQGRNHRVVTAIVAALALAIPAGWHVTTASVTPITDPVERFVLYSGAAPRPGGPPRAGQVVAIVMEQRLPKLSLFPRRPRQFRLRRFTTMENWRGKRWAAIVFRDRCRAFYIFAGVGTRADSQIPTLLRALDSLRVS